MSEGYTATLVAATLAISRSSLYTRRSHGAAGPTGATTSRAFESPKSREVNQRRLNGPVVVQFGERGR